MNPQTYVPAYGETPVAIVQARPGAAAVYEALKAAMEAERTLDAAMADVPDYLPTSMPVDHYGPQLSAFNEAVNALGDALGITG